MPLNVKHGDTHDVFLVVADAKTKVPVDISGSTVRLNVRKGTENPITLIAVVEDGPLGRIKHTLTGTLAVGTYKMEVELTKSGVITTAPTIGTDTLTVAADIA